MSVDRSLILQDTSEIKIMSQSGPVIITLSSSSDTSVDLATHTKNTRTKSSSPDLFSTYDEFNITCSQKNQSNRKKRVISLLKNCEEIKNKKSLEADILANNLQTMKEKTFNSSINKCSSKSTKLQSTDSIIDLDKEKTPAIDNSIMERNLILHQRSNSSFLQQNNKITKYLCNEQISSKSINHTSQTISSIMPITVETPKTPKRKISGRSLKANSVSKKSPHTKSTPTTPSSLRNWLIISTSGNTSTELTSSETEEVVKNQQKDQVNEKTTKRRRLDKFF